MVTFAESNPPHENSIIEYTFHFVNGSTQGNSLCFNLDATLAQVGSGSAGANFSYTPTSPMSGVVNPGQTISCSFTANQLFQSGGPFGPNAQNGCATGTPLVQIMTSPVQIAALVQFWSGKSAGNIIGEALDVLKTANAMAQTALDAADGDVIGAICEGMKTAQDLSAAVQSANNDSNQYINIIVSMDPSESNVAVSLDQSLGWIQDDAKTQNTPQTNVALNNYFDYTMQLTINGGGYTANTQNIYVQYSD